MLGKECRCNPLTPQVADAKNAKEAHNHGRCPTYCFVYMSNATPATTTTLRAPGPWLNFAGAAFCRVGVGLVELGPVTAGSGLTKLVVVITTTPPLSMVEVKVDVTGLGKGADVKVGFPVVGFDVPEERVSTFAPVTPTQHNSNGSSTSKRASVETDCGYEDTARKGNVGK